MPTLSITVKYGEYFLVGDAKITLTKGNGQVIASIEAPADVIIKRKKLVEQKLTKVTNENTVDVQRKIKYE